MRHAPLALLSIFLLATSSVRGVETPPQTLPGAPPVLPVLPELLGPRQLQQQLESLWADPPSSGALIVDMTPNSPAQKAGLLLGDIVTRLAGQPVDTAEDLKSAVAQTLAEAELQPGLRENPVLIRIRRGDKKSVFSVPRGGLGLVTRTLTAGIPGRLNPPPTPVTFAELSVRPGGMAHWMRLTLRGQFCGAEEMRLEHEGIHWQLHVQTLLGPTADQLHRQQSRQEFLSGNGLDTPGWSLESLSYQGEGFDLTAKRRGLNLLGRRHCGTVDGVAEKFPTDLRGVTTLGLPILAAAMPQEADAVYPFALINELTLQTRLGWSLVSRGRTPIDGTEAFLVEAWYWGQVERRFYFDAQRQLLRSELPGGLVAQRVTSFEAATTP